jgi:hypothetical protein
LLTLVLLAAEVVAEVEVGTCNLEVLEVVQQAEEVQVETEQMQQVAVTVLVAQVGLEHLQLSEDLVQAEEGLLEFLSGIMIVHIE